MFYVFDTSLKKNRKPKNEISLENNKNEILSNEKKK